MHAMLTTTVANYIVADNQHTDARNHAMLVGNDSLFQLWNDRLELIQSIGKTGVVPAIWTHTPVPMGLDVIALKQRFEERAASVLGDYEYTPPFTVCSPDGTGMFKDNRYVCPSLRAAWMMYVDQAIENFNSK